MEGILTSIPVTAARGGIAPQVELRVGLLVEKITRWLAISGGFVLTALIILTVTSITGRFFIFAGLGPVPGDFELVEVCTAFAVFSFLPWCQYKRGHVTVDIFVSWLSPRKMAFLAMTGNLLLSAVAGVIFWRLVLGTLDKQAYNETTFILQFPLWWGYAACLLGSFVFLLVALYTVWRSFNEMMGVGEMQTPDASENTPT
jgi:TRAP-type C4-dicarboxylate transport system permease small subunit